MDRTTQPILCCIGESLAGNATQYVMERMMQSLNLDWRVLSVEVEPSDFSTAMAGMRAMKFCAVRVLDPYQSQTASEFFEHDPLAQFIGEVNAVQHGDEGWLAWNSAGQAVLRSLQDCNRFGSPIVLADDSPMSRSTLVALLQTYKKAERSQNSPLSNRVARFGDWGDESLVAEQLRDILPNEVLPEPTRDAAGIVGTLENEGEVLPEHVCVIGQDPSLNAQVLDALSMSAIACKLIGPISESEYPNVDCISSTELAIRILAVDFESWTGQAADLQLIRDAYEEFTDF